MINHQFKQQVGLVTASPPHCLLRPMQLVNHLIHVMPMASGHAERAHEAEHGIQPHIQFQAKVPLIAFPGRLPFEVAATRPVF